MKTVKVYAKTIASPKNGMAKPAMADSIQAAITMKSLIGWGINGRLKDTP